MNAKQIGTSQDLSGRQTARNPLFVLQATKSRSEVLTVEGFDICKADEIRPVSHSLTCSSVQKLAENKE